MTSRITWPRWTGTRVGEPEQLWREGRRASAADLAFRPLWRFVKAYFLGLSILDGRFGLVTSLLGAQTAFLKYAHLWAMEHKSDQPT